MSDVKKAFYCEQCLVEFAITMEPSMDPEEVGRQAPDSIVWLQDITDCPACGEALSER